jgi:2-phosphosulfolactate phosphatase
LRIFGSITVIAAGERWPDGSLRFAIEDLIGAGAVIEGLGGSKSPEASLAEAAFRDGESSIKDLLQECASGRELIERGFERDVELAAELNVSEAVPGLADGRFTNLSI